MPSLTRRDILGLTTTGLSLGLAGCSLTGTIPPSDTPATSSTDTTQTTDTPSTSTPRQNGRASPAPSCRDGYSSLDPGWVVEGPGPLGGFDLTLEPNSIAHGDTITATLENVTDEQQTTGYRKKYDIQYHGERGWHTIFGTEEETRAVWHDIGITHQPGEGFTWELTVTQDGLSGAIDGKPTYHVCMPLKAGTYRFVYWGVTSQKEVQNNYETEYALGVTFTVSRDWTPDNSRPCSCHGRPG